MSDASDRPEIPRNPVAVTGLVIAGVAALVGLLSWRVGLLVALAAFGVSVFGYLRYRRVGVGRIPAMTGMIASALLALSASYFVVTGL